MTHETSAYPFGDVPRMIQYLPGVAAGLSGMVPGRYLSKEDAAWRSFTLHSNGWVVFIDSRDGHESHYVCTPYWARSMQELMATGLLVREALVRHSGT